MRQFFLQFPYFFKIIFKERLVQLSFGLERLMFKAGTYFFDLFHQIPHLLIDKTLLKFFENKIGSSKIWMNQIYVVKSIIAQYIYNELIGGKIMRVVVLFYQLVHCFDQPCLAPVVFDHPITDMTNRANGKHYLQPGIELP